MPGNSPTIIDDKLELVGTKGVAYVDSCDYGVKFISDLGIEYPDTRHWYTSNGEVQGDLAIEIQTFVNDVLAGRPSIITPEEALDSLKVVDAIERSIAEGIEVIVK